MNIYNVGIVYFMVKLCTQIEYILELTLPVSYQEDKYQTASHQKQQTKSLQLLKF